MASKKDLVEAYAYNRRRLTTAFVSGAPGGREVEPSRPGRSIIVGVVLAGLVVGAGAIGGIIKPTVKDGWDDNSLVVGRDSGARYFASKGNLFPVANTASARLLAPPGEFEVVFAPEDKIAETNLQDRTLGIPGAPDSLPRPEDLLQSGWVSCFGKGEDGTLGTSLLLSGNPTATPADGQAFVVSVGKAKSVITGERAYPASDEILGQLGLGEPPVEVPSGWLDQFTKGQELKPLSLPGVGAALGPDAGLPAGVVSGDILAVNTGIGTVERYVATPQGAARLTEVQFLMYSLGNAPGQPKTLNQAPARLAGQPAEFAAASADWPAAKPLQYTEPVACVILQSNDRTVPRTVFARPVPDAYLGTKPDGTVAVDPGRGALVTAGSGAPVFLVDALGKAYALGSSTTRAQLGFDEVDPAFVLAAWIEALNDGVQLSSEAASKEVSTTTTAQAAP